MVGCCRREEAGGGRGEEGEAPSRVAASIHQSSQQKKEAASATPVVANQCSPISLAAAAHPQEAASFSIRRTVTKIDLSAISREVVLKQTTGWWKWPSCRLRKRIGG